jgi:rod shape-determining protein MreC
VFSALALFLMVADTRFRLTQPLRIALAAVVYPVQWLVMRPVLLGAEVISYFESLKASQSNADTARQKLGLQSQRANQVEQLSLENARLRKILDLRARIATPSQAAQVLYDSADTYSRRVVIDKGLLQGVSAGSPVLDERGVLGQVTRVYPSVSEVTLVTDREQAIPVLNVRTGARAVAFGDPGAHANALELRFMASNADVQVGDVLTTSGVDGVYPPGLPVARVDKIERRVETAFAHIFCTPLAGVDGALHVMVLQPVSAQIPARPVPEVVPKIGKKGAAP